MDLAFEYIKEDSGIFGEGVSILVLMDLAFESGILRVKHANAIWFQSLF